jgi:hypothetical protein
MLRAGLLAACLIALPALTWASIDPGITIESGDPPFVFLGGITNNLNGVQPTTTSPDITYELNDDNAVITSLTFDMTINPGLLVRDVLNTFSCSQPRGQAYFLRCRVTYTPSTGDLKYVFSGVRRPDGDELCPALDCEVGEREGIPPGASFFVVLTGWVPDLTINDPVEVYSGLPVFSNSFTTAAPEPSTLWTLALVLLLVGWVVERRRRITAAER